MRWIDLDGHHVRVMRRDAGDEGAVAAGRLEHAALVSDQGEHALDDGGRREHLPARGDVAGRFFGGVAGFFGGIHA